MEKFNKNKIQYVGVRPGEKDIDDAIPIIDYTNMNHEIKNHCIKLCKEAISKIKITYNKFNLWRKLNLKFEKPIFSCFNFIKIIYKQIETTPESNISYFKNLAKLVKKALEDGVDETWNVVVGTDFGAFCSFEKTHLIYFRLNEIYFLIFRFGASVKN